ncbi:MAG TPA: zinc-dependent alcohol dehydrogenase family protein [Actinomycetota bacterium]|nr:zinc-dependent alcohol dehydrogenase family protein [Actinomycetota bacterium]
MHAWKVARPGAISTRPLEWVEMERPEPGPGEIRVKVTVCGVCRTDLHVAEGDLEAHKKGVVPGHEVVGVVDAQGADSRRFENGERVGIPWLRHTCGRCRFCLRGDENLCLQPEFTGWDADGGYAEYALVPEDFAYRLPDLFDDEHAAPLLCAGVIGYRALRRSNLPAGGRLGIYGFGGSAHIAAQVAIAEGAEVHVGTRSEAAQCLALDLGAVSAADPADDPGKPLDAALLFAPSGDLIPGILQALDRGGTLAVAGVHVTQPGQLDYQRHLFYEKVLTTVTANTRKDGEEFLELAGRIGLNVSTQPYGLGEADVALRDLAEGRVRGAAVLRT